MANATQTKPATGGRTLTKYCKTIGATWTWDKYRPDEITIAFADGAKLVTNVAYPEDYGDAVVTAQIFMERNEPGNPHKFRELAPNEWHRV